MYELIKLFFEICMFKKGPEDIPVSYWLFRLLILVYACLSYIILAMDGYGFKAALQVLFEVFLILGLCWIILFFAKKIERYQHTTCALLATDALISFFSLPAMASLIGQGNASAFIVVVLLMIWHWAVSGHIFSRALDQPIGFGLGVSFLYILTFYQVMGFLFIVKS